MLRLLFSSRPGAFAGYEAALAEALAEAGLDAEVREDWPAEEVDYILYAPVGRLRDFTPFTRAKAVLSLWAGVEHVVDNPTLHLPLARMVDDGLERGMVEYVAAHVLRHHVGLDAHVVNPAHDWAPRLPKLARERRVTILGLGALGRACAEALAGFGFDVTGWSRRPKTVAGIRCLSGPEGLAAALEGAEILVTLLPLTQATESLVDADALARLAPGAILLNPGRGALIDEEALLAALDSGQLSHATLDVFRKEPLRKDHPFWQHPQVTVTPHIAAETRPRTAARVIAENIRRHEAGEPLLHLVDRAAGY
ncbi:2-hydroxyacid dehydrogenase [Pseudoroseicyclus tamaricis]|uniref:Glyoxylate/hydroxypyruvate reductase A n=1 Tax=Pseudoroseicyclus tamaricis TaxID=2705421 RepID=A0A6B2K189_9RHOB|nr:glyoxylate/hydroxypyruvate reductase A [Pseudoroseicyclus tamaricis]NDV02204.1 glyoxylate/hydroxypyruvate reductase A [Pseudoroseicyclus tamaricis]